MESESGRSDAEAVLLDRAETGKWRSAEGEGEFGRPTFETPITAEDFWLKI
jgi:hypothetical protein